MINTILETLSYPFMRQALAVGLVVALTCAVLSCFLVLKGWSLMGDAISHAILPGVVFAAVFNFPFVIGAFFAGLLCALGTGWLENNSNIKADTLLGIVFSAMFALGIILFLHIESDQHLMHVLFGNLLGMYPNQRYQVYAMSIVVLSVMAFKWRDFALFVFDPAQARVVGLSVGWLYFSLLILLSLTAVTALQAVGVVLVVAMLITPGISAQLVCKRFSSMVIVACIISSFSTITGILISLPADASTSACIVLVQAAMFIVMLTIRYLLLQYRQLFWMGK